MRSSLTLPDKTYKRASKLAKELGSSIASVLRMWIHKGMKEPIIKTTKKIPMSERIKESKEVQEVADYIAPTVSKVVTKLNSGNKRHCVHP